MRIREAPLTILYGMRSFLVGLYSGLLLSALRAPLGLELLQLPARDPHAAMAFRGAALLAVAVGAMIGLRKAAARFSPATLLSGVALGFTGHWMYADVQSQLGVGLVLSVLLVLLITSSHRGGDSARPDKRRILLAALAALLGLGLLELGHPEAHSTAVVACVLGAASIALVGSLSSPEQDPDERAWRPAPGRFAALVISGAGLAMMCEGLARPVRQLGAGLATDDDVFGSVFLALAAFGGLAFGRLFTQQKSREVVRNVLLLFAVGAAFASTLVLENITTVRGLDRLVRRFGLDLSLHGMLSYDALISATVFVVPAFVIGTVITLCKRPNDLISLCVGAAAGMVLVPGQLSYLVWAPIGTMSASDADCSSMTLTFTGAACAALGVVLASFAKGSLSVKPRAILGVGSVIICLGTFLYSLNLSALQFSRPWETRPPITSLYIDAAEGVITLENSPTGSLIAALNGVALAPAPEAATDDNARLQMAWSLLPEGLVDPAVLLVGQLTPERASTLQQLGAARIDRSAAWHKAMPLLEDRLFDGKPLPETGEVLDPRGARAKLDAGEYDLVIVPPLAGELPTTRNLASPAQTTVVLWFDGTTGVESLALGEEVIVSAPGLSELFIGVARGQGVAASRARHELGAPAWLAAGEPSSPTSALETLRTRGFARKQRALTRLSQRLAEAELAPGLAAGLARHFAAQVVDSPFDTWQVALELDPEAQRSFARAAASETPSALAIEVIEALALVLRGKRRIDELYATLEPAASRHAPWPALEVALAQADLELLNPAATVSRLQALHTAWSGTPESWAMLAEAQQQVGEEAGAAASLDRALELAPSSHELERRRAIAWIRAGRPGALEALEEVLLEHPDDEELLQYRTNGPWKAVRPGFHALAGHQH